MQNTKGTTAKNSSQVAEEVVKKGHGLTKIVKDGNQFEHEIINLDHPDWAPTTGMVEIFPLKVGKGFNGAKRHDNDVSFSVVRDREAGFLIGIVNGTNGKTGDLKFDKIVVKNIEILDLSVPRERRKFICFKMGPFYKDSPNRIYSSKTLYDITDHEKAAETYLTNHKLKRSASAIAENLKGEELREMAYMIGLDPKIMTPIQLYVEVMKFAESEQKVDGKTGSQRFMEAYNSDTRHEMSILKRALSVGLMEVTHDKGIVYNGLTVGWSEEEAIRYLKNNSSLAVSIDAQTRGKIDNSTQVLPMDVAKVKTEEQARIEQLQEELDNAKPKIAEQNLATAESAAEANLADIDPEYADMLVEFKRYKKGGHLIGKNDPIEVRKLKLREALDKEKQLHKN